MEIICSPEFIPLMHALFPEYVPASAPSKPKYMPTMDNIPISRVVYSSGATTVFFTDGTKTTVRCSSNDTYDRQTAIAYALVKRMFGKVGRYDEKTKKFYENEIDGNGLGLKLEKIAAAGFDQDLEKKNLNVKKAEAKAAHVARQKAEHDAAWQRRVARRAEEIRLEREAAALVDRIAGKKPLNETVDLSTVVPSADEFFGTSKPAKKACKDTYVRPNKPFSKFTQQEKRDYWNAQNAKRRAAK